MSAMSRSNFMMALSSIRAARWRSTLTMLGIIVGIVSVVMVVSIGEGVKNEMSKQISQFGKDLITIKPGSLSSHKRTINNTDLLFGMSGVSGLTSKDLTTVQKTSGVRLAAPLGVVSGQIKTEDRTAQNPLVVATNASFLSAINHSLEYGDFFDAKTENTTAAVIGQNVASELFRDDAPLGRSFQFRGHSFIVRGVLANFYSTPLSPTADFNNAIFIPYSVAEKITDGSVQMYSILVKPSSPDAVGKTVAALEKSLTNSRGGVEDFQVLDQEKNIASTSNVLSLLTAMIAAVAAISLLVGGVGIMNIMLATVTERTHEIGVRKAIGATNRQIMNQFVVESAVISMLGGLIGTLISLAAVGLLRLYTDLRPIISWQAIVIATVVSLVIGVVFGAMPALKAARKDPIDSLRYE